MLRSSIYRSSENLVPHFRFDHHPDSSVWLSEGFNFGIDFTGGTIIDLKFNQPVSIAEVRTRPRRAATSTMRPSSCRRTVRRQRGEVGGRRRQSARDLEEEDQRKEVMATLRAMSVTIKVLREEKVGADDRRELITNAILALASSRALIIPTSPTALSCAWHRCRPRAHPRYPHRARSLR